MSIATAASTPVTTQDRLADVRLGSGSVTSVEATSDGRGLLGPVTLPLELRAGEKTELPCDTNLDPGAGARLSVGWVDGSGAESTAERYQSRG